MIEVIRASAITKKHQVEWDRAAFRYILAPENASAGNELRAEFEEVWQYGSDLGQTDADPMWQQDGVAPQAAAGGINRLPFNKSIGGRAFIPKSQDTDKKGFVESHSVGNYEWIFGNNLKEGDPGYVTPR